MLWTKDYLASGHINIDRFGQHAAVILFQIFIDTQRTPSRMLSETLYFLVGPTVEKTVPNTEMLVSNSRALTGYTVHIPY